MGVINVLDKHIAELIAAGEVVERPSSVIKELVENSIDAGAKNITVEIKNGGTTFMRVADDGCGIYRDDIKKAFLRHATSKVKTANDLDMISTLGFRGEALASISAVSRLQVITKNENEEIGSCYEIEGGDEISLEEAGCPTGTTFVIRDLFYNIPARSKFLKKMLRRAMRFLLLWIKSYSRTPKLPLLLSGTASRFCALSATANFGPQSIPYSAKTLQRDLFPSITHSIPLP